MNSIEFYYARGTDSFNACTQDKHVINNNYIDVACSLQHMQEIPQTQHEKDVILEDQTFMHEKHVVRANYVHVQRVSLTPAS